MRESVSLRMLLGLRKHQLHMVPLLLLQRVKSASSDEVEIVILLQHLRPTSLDALLIISTGRVSQASTRCTGTRSYSTIRGS